ncbi:MAG: mechanosensitive ion channel domain-containing protein [Acetobacteraceae bacterium]
MAHLDHIELRNRPYMGRRAMSSALFAAIALALIGAFAPGARAATSTAASPPISAAQARQALDVLTDPARRAQVLTTLEAIVHAEVVTPASHPAAPAIAAAASPLPATTPKPPPAIKLNPNSLGAAVVLGARGFLGNLWSRTAEAARAVQSLPLLWGWIVVMTTNPMAHGILRAAAWRVAVAFAAGIAVEIAVRRLLRRPIAVIEMRAPPANGASRSSRPEDDAESGEARAELDETEPPRPRRVAALILLRRLPLVFARLLFDLLPVLAFVVVGHIVAASQLGGTETSRLVVLAMVDAYALSAGAMTLVRMMLSPDGRRLRLLRVSDAIAAWATRWIRRLIVVAVFGYAIAEVGLALGMSQPAHDGLLKIAGLINHVFIGVMVVQKRRAVKNFLRAPAGATGPLARLRNALAPVWHWIALFFLVAIWVAWAIEIPNGYGVILRFFVSIVVVLVAARLVLIVLLGLLERVGHVRPELAERYPGLETRLALYHPVVGAIARAIVYLCAAVVLLAIWGVPLFAWFADSLLGRRLAAGLGTLALTLFLAVAVWEAVNAAMQAHLARLTREQQVSRSARLRTLLPLLRSALLVTIVVIAGLTVLSQIGINIGPLLAGAGIVGVAIGFGSQKLVQDLITGIFLLLENAMQVGDWVTVSGLSGTVEALSVRTIRLRAGDGSVHIIPFSSVTSVTNTNRGLGNAAVSVTVSYAEDTDRVSQLLEEIVAGMRAEPEFAARMLSDLQLWGVDKLDGAGATITGQIVCTAPGRWPVQREFNRRVKKRFEDEDVEIYNPARTVVVPLRAPATSPALSQAQAEPAAGGGT